MGGCIADLFSTNHLREEEEMICFSMAALDQSFTDLCGRTYNRSL